MDMQRPETAPELLETWDVDILVAKENDAVLNQSLVDLLGPAVAEWFGQIDVADLGAKIWAHRGNADCVIAHRWSPTFGVAILLCVRSIINHRDYGLPNNMA